MFRCVEQILWRAKLDNAPVMHHHDLVGKGQRLCLVMRDIDHRMAEFVVQCLELGAQFPFHMRVDHGQRFVEQDRVDILAHHAAAKADLLLGICRQAARLAAQLIFHPDHLGDLLYLCGNRGRGHPAIAQGKGQIVTHRHRVVDDGKLEHLRDIARHGVLMRHIAVAKQDPPA